MVSVRGKRIDRSHRLRPPKCGETRCTTFPQHLRGSLRRRLFVPPAAPEGLVAHWDRITKEFVISWRPMPAMMIAAAAPGQTLLPVAASWPPVRDRAGATLA
ncbi:hypothetical protein PAPYR_4492 [Paratrimastix pyriformis]|uniref:Uncharacterized protein n=1 Tax=Paratrimastix pyriformis TaxID=342808 RepID=A0ABQ8UJN5_9EUKA|nr:hypothetical protein PAPYR_4492 [Paratrimastix pyriformis]